MDEVKRFGALFISSMLLSHVVYADVVFDNREPLTVTVNAMEPQVVHTAFHLFQQDYKSVFGQSATQNECGTVVAATIGMNPEAEKRMGKHIVDEVRSHAEAFALKVIKDKIYILGSDKRGTAYGILELSRIIGVSPWIWWADSPVKRKSALTLKEDFFKLDYPSVRLRGIFINDEDWGITPWSATNYEPTGRKGSMGPKTHARIFELLLRLRANLFWPAMHACTVPFYQMEGNKETADKYGIMIGTSHCEPMMCNANGEWKQTGVGEYNYITNRCNILHFWETRVKELAGSDNVYTLGLRGIHDGPMQGAKTAEQQKSALADVLTDQRNLLARYINKDVTKIPQVFIPYKEVLDAYHAGLQVPEDVTLVWCDDNYGYIRHYPTPEEQNRVGGNGLYYHISYWGRPHDYLWLATTHPALVYTQLKKAYDDGIRDLWLLNVGDIKPAEYLTELFMDMAWNIHAIENNEKGVQQHLSAWLTREFGVANAMRLLPVMNEYYRLAYICKPEFMANTRVEEKDTIYKVVKDMPWGLSNVQRRIADYETIEQEVETLSAHIPSALSSSWFQLIEYPVRAAAEMNLKFMYGQLARHGLTAWSKSDAACDTIVSLTHRYDTLNKGKWRAMMNYHPRDLRDFSVVPHFLSSQPMPHEVQPLILWNGCDYISYTGIVPFGYGLGYQGGAVSLSKGSSVVYQFTPVFSDSLTIEVALAPNHPCNGNQLRYAVSVDNEKPQVVDFHTEGRSEEWKQNVLRNQAVRRTIHYVEAKKSCQITITAMDENIVLDQIKVFSPSSVTNRHK